MLSTEFDWSREILQQENELANVSLISHGLLGCSPLEPTTAFTLEALELYHQIRRRQPSFSIQAITKVLCALNNVSQSKDNVVSVLTVSASQLSYSQHLRNQFSVAFDVYLAILRHIKRSANQALGWDGPGWRLQNSCPPCRYKVSNHEPIWNRFLQYMQLDGEPLLIPASLHAMDGNSSVKWVDGSGVADLRAFESDYLVTADEVDIFKDEVTCKSRPAPPDSKLGRLVSCTDNWTVANTFSEETVKVFEQTGIFLSACRHGMIEMFTEMRRSGEL
jgi:hypothetical protein